MRTDMRTHRGPFVTMIFGMALALAAPQTGIGQGPAVRSDSTTPASTAKAEDAWYPEGPVQIRGKRYSFFVGATYTWFINGTSRSRYGQGQWSPSFELYRPQRHGYSPLVELNGTNIATSDSTARIFAVSVGIRYRPVDAERTRRFVLNAGLATGPRWARISGQEQTTVLGVSMQVGLEVLRIARVNLRYEALPAVHGARLSTMSLGTAVRLPPYGRGSSRDSPTPRLAPVPGARDDH